MAVVSPFLLLLLVFFFFFLLHNGVDDNFPVRSQQMAADAAESLVSAEPQSAAARCPPLSPGRSHSFAINIFLRGNNEGGKVLPTFPLHFLFIYLFLGSDSFTVADSHFPFSVKQLGSHAVFRLQTASSL